MSDQHQENSTNSQQQQEDLADQQQHQLDNTSSNAHDDSAIDPLAATNRTTGGDSDYQPNYSDGGGDIQSPHGFDNRPSFREGSGAIETAAGSQFDLSRNLSRRKSSVSHQSSSALAGQSGSLHIAGVPEQHEAHDHHHHQHADEQEQHEGEKLPCNVRPAPPLPRDPIDGALQQFPVGFLKYSDNIAEDAKVVTVGAADPFLSAKLASQRHSLTETPVVTGSTDTVLDALLPPRRTTVTYINEEEGFQDTVDVVHRVSHSQIKREELRHLRVELDARIRESNARHEGICSVRRGIHALMFDELIRQVTIDCPERGILLRRVRDEIQMTLDAYHTLYEESVAYSTNRCVASAKHTPAMTSAIESLNKDINELRKELRKLQAKESAMLRCVAEQEDSDHRRYDEEKTFLERTQQRLQTQLEAVKEAQEAQRRALREQAF